MLKRDQYYDRLLVVNGIPLTILALQAYPSYTATESLRIVPPPWSEVDFKMLCNMMLVSLVASLLCLSSYVCGYYDSTIDYDTLLPVQLLTAVFFGILFGFAIFTSTRTFYNSNEVIRAIHTAHKTQSGRIKKMIKATSQGVKKSDKASSSRPKLPSRRQKGHRT